MTTMGLFTKYYRQLLALASLVVILVAIHAMASVFTTLLLAFFITIVVAPALTWLQAHGLSRRLALVVVMAVATMVFLAFALTVLYAVAELVRSLPAYERSLAANSTISSFDETVRPFIPSAVPFREQASDLTSQFIAALRSLLSGLGSAMLILFVFALFLLDADRVPAIVNDRFAGHRALENFGRYRRLVGAYFVNTALLNIIIAGASSVLLWLLGVPNPLLWGITIFILRFVPVIGIWLALIPITFTAFVEVSAAIGIVAFIGIALINGVVSSTLYYRLMGTGLNLSPATTFVSLFFWTFVLGPLGAILALPLTLMVKMLLLDDGDQMVSDIISYKRAMPDEKPAT